MGRKYCFLPPDKNKINSYYLIGIADEGFVFKIEVTFLSLTEFKLHYLNRKSNYTEYYKAVPTPKEYLDCCVH